MAKESSFDVVSTVDIQEADNAYQQASRELSQRYDLKQTGATLSFSKGEGTFTLTAPSEFVAGQVRDVLAAKLAKRGIDLASLRWADPQPSSGGGVRQAATLVQGIDKETAKRISKDIRDLKLKCKATVEETSSGIVRVARHPAAGHRRAPRKRLRSAPPVRELQVGSC